MRRGVFLSVIGGALCGLCSNPAYADVKLNGLFTDHMVLQQKTTVPVWGKADPDEKVTVTLQGKSATATAGADGKWM
jgi:sialate O-acetylesterase